MRVEVDFDRCDSHGTCVDLCPEVFDLNDDDELLVLDSEPPEELRAKLKNAVLACPKAAITLAD